MINDRPISATGARWRRAVPAGAMACTLLLGACGDGGDNEEAAPAPTPTTPTTAEQAAGDVEAFCQALVDVNSDPGPDIDFESASEEEVAAALRDFAGTFEPKLQALEGSAPPQVREQTEVIVGFFREGLASGDDSFFEAPEFSQAEGAVDEFALGQCGFPEIEVTAVDYAFEGVPATVEAGTVAFSFTNQGGEHHEMAIARINDDVEVSVEELLMLPEGEAESMVTYIGGGFAEPGEGDAIFLNLEPGRYGVVCFMPVGSTTEAVAAAEERGEEVEGAPHFTEGMFASFTVE